MQRYIPRHIEAEIKDRLLDFPVVALLGPRQCGKSTLAKQLLQPMKDVIYLDLEKPSDARKLEDPEFFFSHIPQNLICLDEIQRKPEIFQVLRSIIDENRTNGKFLILGSASRDLIRQSSETLAGRICYIELTPFLINEVSKNTQDTWVRHWNRGGFPDSYLARNDNSSRLWRESFIRTFLERDIPQLGFNISPGTLRRLWSVLAHLHGQLLNSSKLGEMIGVSHTSIRTYVDLLAQTFMIRLLLPHETNLKKRLVKSPKIYIRDSGILHSLLEIDNTESLFGHPVFGNSWEGFALENILVNLKDWSPSFYRTSSGVEIDLILQKGLKKIAVEFKASKSPSLSKGLFIALKDLAIKDAYIIAPVDEPYKINEHTTILSLNRFIQGFGVGLF
ncbi:MAG: ATP-binding protein [Proteobacteria bacterium]|nr:ATP-binding protein [Pseudomonadota bacterium]